MESAASAPDPADVESIDAIVTAAYDGISGRPERSAIGIASAPCIFQVLVLFQPL